MRKLAIAHFFFLIIISSQSYAIEWRENGRIDCSNYRKGPTLLDVERFLKHPNIYEDSDLITSTHEQLHGVNSKCRQLYKAYGLTTCVYIPRVGTFKVACPNTTLAQIAPRIPQSLRGSSYNLYLISQQRYWNNEPGYLLDEWSCYYAGSLTRAELGITQRGETVKQMLDFMVYSLYMMKSTKESNPALEKFIAEQIYRTADAYHANLKIGNIEDSTQYLEKIKKEKVYWWMMEVLQKYPRR